MSKWTTEVVKTPLFCEYVSLLILLYMEWVEYIWPLSAIWVTVESCSWHQYQLLPLILSLLSLPTVLICMLSCWSYLNSNWGLYTPSNSFSWVWVFFYVEYLITRSSLTHICPQFVMIFLFSFLILNDIKHHLFFHNF